MEQIDSLANQNHSSLLSTSLLHTLSAYLFSFFANVQFYGLTNGDLWRVDEETLKQVYLSTNFHRVPKLELVKF